MQIASTLNKFQANRALSLASTKTIAFQPATPSDIADIGNSVEKQDRFDGKLFGQMVGGMIGGGIGATGGTILGTVVAAAAGAGGWGTAAAGACGLLGGAAVGAYIGSR